MHPTTKMESWIIYWKRDREGIEINGLIYISSLIICNILGLSIPKDIAYSQIGFTNFFAYRNKFDAHNWLWNAISHKTCYVSQLQSKRILQKAFICIFQALKHRTKLFWELFVYQPVNNTSPSNTTLYFGVQT